MHIKNKNIIIYAFWMLVIFSIFGIINIFLHMPNYFQIQNLNSILEPIAINVEFENKIKTNDMLVCYNDYCRGLFSDNFYNVYHDKFNFDDDNFYSSKISKIYIAYPIEYKKLNENISDIFLYIGVRAFHYNKKDIKKFNTYDFSIKIQNSDVTKNLAALELPKISNYKGILNHITVLFLSLFSNWLLFIIPYFWLFIAFLIYIFNKDIFKFNFDYIKKYKYLIILLIIFLGAILRINNISYSPLWLDEVYTKTVAISSFKSVFQDAGNPPLFFFLEYVFGKIFTDSDLVLRILPCVFGIASISVIYLLFKNISEKAAIFVSFLFAVNSINIYYSQEARAYSLCMLLVLLSVYFLFKYLKNPNDKNLFFYIINTIFALNTNYYLVLFSVSNLIWGIVDLFQNKNKILKFLLANIFAILTFIPYLLISFKTAVNETFNKWIPVLSSETFIQMMNEYFLNKYLFMVFCLVLIFNLFFCYIPKFKFINKEKENLLIYLTYSIVLILILASLISVFIKPILHVRVLLSLYSLFFLIEAILILSVFDCFKFNFSLKILKNFYSVILIFILFSVTTPLALRDKLNIDNYMSFIEQDADKFYSQGYEINALIPDYIKYLDNYPNVKNKKYIKWHKLYPNQEKIEIGINPAKYSKKTNKVIIYANSIGMEFNSSYFNPKIYTIKTNTIPNIRYKM